MNVKRKHFVVVLNGMLKIVKEFFMNGVKSNIHELYK